MNKRLDFGPVPRAQEQERSAAIDPLEVFASGEDQETIAVALAALAPPAEPPKALRDRLLESVAALPKPLAGHEPIPGITFKLMSEGNWVNVGLPGVDFKYLLVDPVRRYVRTLVRMAPGSLYPSHQHHAREETFLLQGDLHIDGQDMSPGDYCVAEAGTAHGVLSTRGGALFMAFACLDDAPISGAELAAIRATAASSSQIDASAP